LTGGVYAPNLPQHCNHRIDLAEALRYELADQEEGMLWLLWVIIVGLIAGWATGKIMKGSGYGAFMDIILGIVGGIVGGWIIHLFGFQSTGGLIPSILVAILGAVFLVWLARKLRGA
jgi:uncharacterized membrane protein YeaQ/YmgE (transglycosylase-associated protein family)